MKKALRGCYKIFSILLVIVTAFSMCLVHVGHVHAQETNIQGTDVSTPRDGNVMLLVNGTRRAATVDETLRLINKIRWNACQKKEYYPKKSDGTCYGDRHLSLETDTDVTDPTDAQLSKKNGDYVPLVWNDECEQVAEIRAVETFLMRGHQRVNSFHSRASSYAMNFNTSHRYIEANAYHSMNQYGKSQYSIDEDAIEATINIFDSEQEAYLTYGDHLAANESTSGLDETGHYSQMINPSYQSVGVADFLSGADDLGNTNSRNGDFGVMELFEDVPETTNTGRCLTGAVSQKIEFDQKYVNRLQVTGTKSYSSNTTNKVKIYANVQMTKGTGNYRVVDGLTSTSSNTDVAEMDARGNVKAKAAGTATITVTVGNASTLFDVIVTNNTDCDHSFGAWRLDEENEDYEVRTCSKCGKKEQREHPADALTYTNNGDGTHTVTCNCGYKKTQKHDYTDASYNVDDASVATYHQMKCQCGATTNEKHTFGEVKEDRDNDQKHYKTCTVCGYKDYVAHDYGSWSYQENVDTATRTCQTCGHVETEGPLAHHWGSYEYVDDTYCMTKCSSCGGVKKEKHIIKYEDNKDGQTHKKSCVLCKHVLAESEAHDYGDWTYDEDSQTATRTCKSCGYKQVESTHNFGDWSYEDDDHCVRTCKNCGLKQTKEHEFEYVDQGDGTHKKICKNCQHVFDTEDHTWSNASLKDKDDDQYETAHTYTCTKCGAVKDEAHSYATHQVEEIADDDDYHYVICDACGYKKKEEHEYSGWTYDEATKKTIRTCQTCGYVESKSDHNFGDWTYLDNDYCVRTCKDCGYQQTKEHETEYVDQGDGTHKKICKNCQHVFDTEGHIWSKASLKDKDDAQYESAHTYICTKCGAVKDEVHSYATHQVEEIADDDDYHYVICDACGYKKKEEHEYSGWTYDETTNEAVRTCLTCGHKETKSNHNFGDWTYLDDDHCVRTCEDCGYQETKKHDIIYVDQKDGTHKKECKNCHYVFNQEDHTPDASSMKAIDEESHEYTCSKCGAVVTATHNYDTHRVEKIANDDNDHYVICDVCGYKKKEVHDYGDWTYDEATKKTIRTCKTCGYVESKSDHNFGDWTYLDDDYCVRTCSDCGYQETKKHNFEYVDQRDGTHKKICKNCQHVFVTETHSPDLSSVEDIDDDAHEYRCAKCGAIVKTSHSYNTHQVEEIANDDDAHYVICDVCGYKKKEAHDYGAWTYDEEHQIATRTCQTCGYVQTEKDHDYGNWESVNETTHAKTCKNCGIVFRENHDLHYVDNGDGTHSVVCETCDYKGPAENHEWGAWSTSGTNEMRTCTTCGATESRAVTNPTTPTIPTTPNSPATPISPTTPTTPAVTPTTPTTPSNDSQAALASKNIATLTQSVTSRKNDADPKDALYSKLNLKSSKVTKSSIKMTWTNVKGVKTYLVYGGKCGTKYKYIKKTSAKSYTQSKLKKGTYYKYLVIAVDANGKKLATSKVIHVATKGGKNANVTRISVNKKTIKLKVKKSFKLKIKVKKDAKTLRNHRKISYESSNKKVATVSNSGKITAKRKGKAVIYIYSQNGYCQKVNVTVR